MSIKHLINKIKASQKSEINKLKSGYAVRDALFIGILVTACTASYMLGTLSSYTDVNEKHAAESVHIVQDTLVAQPRSELLQAVPEEKLTSAEDSGEVVVSVNGAKYHYPWCPGARSIKEENLRRFSSIQDAKLAGYEPAANCKGLE